MCPIGVQSQPANIMFIKSSGEELAFKTEQSSVVKNLRYKGKAGFVSPQDTSLEQMLWGNQRLSCKSCEGRRGWDSWGRGEMERAGRTNRSQAVLDLSKSIQG